MTKQVPQAGSEIEPLAKLRPSRGERRKGLADRAEISGVGDFWKEGTESFARLSYKGGLLVNGPSFCRLPLKLSKKKESTSSFSTMGEVKARHSFSPAALHLREEQFKEY